MILKTFRKQPNEVKDYDIDYTKWLTPMADTLDFIETNVVCLDEPKNEELIVDRIEITSSLCKVWIKGGTDGLTYKVTVKVSSVGGRIDESELIFEVEEI